MAGTTICPSAAALIRAINTECPEKSEDVLALTKAHSEFVFWAHKVCPKGRDLSLACTKAEEAFFWALKGIGDEVLKIEHSCAFGGGLHPLPERS